MPEISIITPIYNAEKSLSSCIESILNQTFRDFELLLINDGSTDNSGKICDEFAQRDKRIRVFHKENVGVSSARNVGIRNAKGTYSIHVDSDDYVEKTMLEDMYSAINLSGAEMLICDYYFVERNNVNKITQGGYTTNEECISLMMRGVIHGSLCNKLILHSLYYKYSLTFPEDIKIKEDLFICISLLLNDVNLIYLDNAYYYYVQHPNSLTKTNDESLIEKQTESTIKIVSLLADNSKFKDDVKVFKLYNRKDIFISVGDKRIIKKIFPETNRYILKSTFIPFWLRIALISTIWGWGVLSKLLFVIQKFNSIK